MTSTMSDDSLKKPAAGPHDTASQDGPDTDGIIFESEDGEETVQAKLKKLRDQIKACQKEKQEYLDGWQRAKADLINARKRDEEDKRAFAKRSNEDLILELIPVLQSFDAAMANKEAWEKTEKNWRTGVEYIAGQLKKALTDQGLSEINPLGLVFDPSRDDGTEHVAVENEKLHNTVVEVLQKGYTLNGNIVRAPRVRVGEFKK
jgi:molecular chaperone GrpE